MDAAANVKIAGHFAAPRLERPEQVVEDAVGDRLVEGALVPVTP